MTGVAGQAFDRLLNDEEAGMSIEFELASAKRDDSTWSGNMPFQHQQAAKAK